MNGNDVTFSRIDAGRVIASVLDVTSQRSRETLETSVVATLRDLIDARRVTLLRAGERDGTRMVLVMASVGDGLSVLGTDHQPLAGHPVLDRVTTCTEVVEFHLSRPRLYVAACPFLDENGVAEGWLVVESDRSLRRDLKIVAGIAAVYRNYLAVIHSTESDALTGLRNRKTFDDTLARLLVSADTRPCGDSAWLGILDIDHFKRINDTFGHVFGDEVLLLFARLMKDTFRGEDLLFRIGGEEFIVLLAHNEEAGAAAAFERFRQAVSVFPFPQVGSVTVSVGYVRIAGQRTSSEVVARADDALYYAKKNGRNRVCGYESLIAAGLLKAPAPKEGDVELF